MAYYIFTRDLRIEDNTTWNYAIEQEDIVYPIFIFTPEQIKYNKYFSIKSFIFMLECIKELQKLIPLTLLYLDYSKLPKGKYYIMKDYTPYARARANMLDDVYEVEDAVLLPMNTVVKDDGSAYQKFTPYYNKYISILNNRSNANRLISTTRNNKAKLRPVPDELKKYIVDISDIVKIINVDNNNYDITKQQLYVSPGRGHGLSYIPTKYNMNSLETSGLSAYIKFGCVSIREVYNANIKDKSQLHDFRRQLIWREFYYNIAYNYPHVLSINNINRNFRNSNIKWNTDEAGSSFVNWVEGKTGVEFIDASMRQLNETGYMPNRCRLVVADYLIKKLKVSWELGERYFATKLIDYDPALNNGNWQWVAGTGVDFQQYYRSFNPEIQRKKYDPNRVYVSKWLGK